MSEERTSRTAWRGTRASRLRLGLYLLAGLLLTACSATAEQPEALATRVQRAVAATVAARTGEPADEPADEPGPAATGTREVAPVPAAATAAPAAPTPGRGAENPCPYVERAAQAIRDTQDALNAANNGGSWAQARRRIAAVQSAFSGLNEPASSTGSLRVEVAAALSAAGELTRVFEAKEIDEATAGRYLAHQSHAVDLVLEMRERYGCG